MRKIILENKSALMVTYSCMLYEGAITALMVATMLMLGTQYEKTASSISLLITAKSVGTVVTIYFSGKLSDKIGRKKIITIGAIFFMIFLIGMVLTKSFVIAFIFAFLGGVAHGLMDSPSISMLIDIFGQKSGPAMSYVQVFFASGGAITTFLTSQIIRLNLDWKYLYFAYALVGIILIFLVNTAKYPSKNQSQSTVVKVEHKWKPSFRREGLMLATITFMLSSSGAVLNTWLPTFANMEKNMNLVASMQLLTTMQFGNLVGAIVFAYVLTKVHATKLLIFNPSVAFVALATIVFMPQTSMISVFVVGTVMGVLFSLALNIVGDLFPESSGRATGFIGSASMAAGMSTVFFTGKLYPVIGFQNIFKITLGLLLISILLAIYFRIDFKKLMKEDENEKNTLNTGLRSRNG